MEINQWVCDGCKKSNNWLSRDWIYIKKGDIYSKPWRKLEKIHLCQADCLVLYIKSLPPIVEE